VADVGFLSESVEFSSTACVDGAVATSVENKTKTAVFL